MSKIIIETKERPICSFCNIRLVRKGGISINGFRKYQKYCSSCDQKIYNTIRGNRRLGYQLHKKHTCEQCGFIPIHSCQLDVDHIDGNRNNNDISNLKTLCANCHRLKTHNDIINTTNLQF